MMPGIDPIMPSTDPRKERGMRRARACLCIAMGTMLVLVLARPGWTWVPTAFVIAVSVITSIAAAGGLSGGLRGVGGGRGGRGRDDDADRPAGTPSHRWHLLVMMSRLMPRPAGRRWLAEAESVLSEIAPARRGAAKRSYLLSATALVAVTWAREAQRRARAGTRRPG
jgi:hypothetical protein